MSIGSEVSRVAELEALRDRLVVAVGECELRELPGLSRELRQVLLELEGLDDSVGDGIADELDRQRAKRLAGS